MLVGLKFYNKDGFIVLESLWNWVGSYGRKTHTVHLADGERVIGYKSRSFYEPTHYWHSDFQLIIGRLI